MAFKQNLSKHLIKNALVKFTFCIILATIFVGSTSAKNVDLEANSQQQFHHNHHHSHNRRLQRRDSSLKDATSQHCNDVRGYFESIDIKLPQHFNEKGKELLPIETTKESQSVNKKFRLESKLKQQQQQTNFPTVNIRCPHTLDFIFPS